MRACFILVLLLAASFAHAASLIADAAQKSDRATLRKLVKQHADVNAAQADGMTALHWAAYLDDLESAKLLVTAKANAQAMLGNDTQSCDIIDTIKDRGASTPWAEKIAIMVRMCAQ